MSEETTETTETTDDADASLLVIQRNYRSLAKQPGGVVMYAYLSFNEGIGPDRSHGTVSGHVLLKQSGIVPGGSDVGDFIVSGTFAVLDIEPIEPPQGIVVIHFHSVSHLIGAQSLRAHITLDSNWKRGRTTFTYTAKGGHPLVTVSNAKVEQLPIK